MRLTREASAVLGKTSIGMLALRSGRLPLVNPAVFSFAAGSLWMTTSRYAAKTIIAKRDPRAAFLVDGGSKAVLLRGALEVYDPLSLSNDIRAVLDGPGYFLGMAGYALRNPARPRRLRATRRIAYSPTRRAFRTNTSQPAGWSTTTSQ